MKRKPLTPENAARLAAGRDAWLADPLNVLERSAKHRKTIAAKNKRKLAGMRAYVKPFKARSVPA